MSPSGDELAGIVDMFGGLTRQELRQAVREVAFRADEAIDDEDLSAAIDAAVEDYRLVTCDPDAVGVDPDAIEGTADGDGSVGSGSGGGVLVAGPTAFPEVPDAGQDLPLIMDVDRRTVDRETVGRAVARRFRAETARAVENGDHDRAAALLDVSYDIETWAPVDLDDVRTRLDDALEGTPASDVGGTGQ